MDYARMARHLLTSHGTVARTFSPAALASIERAIKKAERGHRGEIRFAAEAALESSALLHEQSARQRAVQVFSLLRVWDTEENNGVLIYVLLADRDVELGENLWSHSVAAPRSPPWASRRQTSPASARPPARSTGRAPNDPPRAGLP